MISTSNRAKAKNTFVLILRPISHALKYAVTSYLVVIPCVGPMSRWQCCIVCGPGAQVPAAAPILPIKIRGPDWAVFWLPAVVSTSKHQIGRMQLSQQKLSCGHREIWFRQSHNSHCKTILKATQQCVEKEKR